MGNRINGFDIELEFDAKGKVAKASYHDSEGCGHEKEIKLDYTVNTLVEYHLSHYRKGHEMTPPRLCGFSVQIEGGKTLECRKPPHESFEPHVFTYRGL